ncbi:MAG: site-2 protease family protein [Planctomycetota bacterium]|nr:MAG: site-2 protease family protein [Planctomycetota bacterium]
MAADPALPPVDQPSQIDVYVGSSQPTVATRPVALPPRRRRVRRPVILFLITCVTTFCAGCYAWEPVWIGEPASGVVPMSQVIAARWPQGLQYMACVLAALMFHEMGHFLMTVRHRVHASFPYFIPFPVMLTGTMGAVIAMDGPRMNRKSLFDIGIAGPLAGLIVIVPLVIVGLLIAEPIPLTGARREYGDPLLVKLLIPLLHPNLPDGMTFLVNPIYMAGWVGMLVTGLNMMPISQLDGGHVSYAVFGRHAGLVARGFVIFVVLWLVWTGYVQWYLMFALVLFLGIDHPPTADDTIDIGWGRRILGVASFAIPVLCFTPIPFS